MRSRLIDRRAQAAKHAVGAARAPRLQLFRNDHRAVLQLDGFRKFRENPLKFRIRTLGLLLGSAVACPIGICDCGKYMAGSGTGVARADLCGRGAMPLYVTASERRVVILRVFTKKTRRTPRREIELARRRAEEVT